MTPPPPYALLAELTHRCPLHCLYCSNPLALAAASTELDTDTWIRVFEQAAELGVLQVHLSGGEPLLRADLDVLTARASASGLYTQLTTSGVGLDQPRARRLADAGLQCVQLSVQAADATPGDRVAGYKAHALKASSAAAVRAAALSLTVNVVLHRLNLDTVGRIIDLALDWGAERLELANAQYYNWALLNRNLLLPAADQVERAHAVVESRRHELSDRLRITWVLPDYFTGQPKPCMGGWGRISLTVAPDGRALPCPAADTVGTLHFDSVCEHPLRWIWEESTAFNAYRGEAWMREPCRSCERRHADFGGCRCQAFALTGDARHTDPACALSPHHDVILAAHRGALRAGAARPLYRGPQRLLRRPTTS